jgi:hypothetical protein
MSLPDFIRPYKDHPLILGRTDAELEILDDEHLNTIMRAEDQIIRGVRNYAIKNRDKPDKLSPGAFSATISIARALAILDVGTYLSNLEDVVRHAQKITPTSSNPASFKHSLVKTVIPHLKQSKLVEFDKKGDIIQIVPYPISSKIYVTDHLINNQLLYNQQVNHFDIIGQVQSFPQPTSTIREEVTRKIDFERDFRALRTVDIVRQYAVGGVDYSFSKEYILSEESLETWKTILETTDTFRSGLNELFNLQTELAGIATTSEIIKATKKSDRYVNQLMRYIDLSGLSQRIHTLSKEDALSRPIPGTLINVNFVDFNNAASILPIVRSVPMGYDIIHKIRTSGEITEDELTESYGAVSVQQIRTTLLEIGVIKQDDRFDGIIKINKEKNSEQLLDEVLTSLAHSRRVITPDYEIDGVIEEAFQTIDIKRLKTDTQKLISDFVKEDAKKSHR